MLNKNLHKKVVFSYRNKTKIIGQFYVYITSPTLQERTHYFFKFENSVLKPSKNSKHNEMISSLMTVIVRVF